MLTKLIPKNLTLFLEADYLAGNTNTTVPKWDDLSTNSRHFTASSNQPLIKENAVNNKKSVVWDGTKNPLVSAGTFELRSGFILVKANADFDNYNGILTALTNTGIIVGDHNDQNLFDFGHKYFEVRVNDQIFSKKFTYSNGQFAENLDCPFEKNIWNLVFFRFWKPFLVDGLQIGNDRDFDRKFNGEIALLAMYSGDMCEKEIRKNTESIAYNYQLPINPVFPLQGSKTDGGANIKSVIADNHSEPITRIKDDEKRVFDISFDNRSEEDFYKSLVFYNEYYPGKPFLYRDYRTVPPVDFQTKFVIPSDFEERGVNVNRFAFGIRVRETIISPIALTPALQSVIEAANPPSAPSPIWSTQLNSSTLQIYWTKPDSDWAIAGYEVEKDGIVSDVGNNLQTKHEFLSPSTHYYRARAYDIFGNYGAWTETISKDLSENIFVDLTIGGGYSDRFVMTCEENDQELSDVMATIIEKLSLGQSFSDMSISGSFNTRNTFDGDEDTSQLIDIVGTILTLLIADDIATETTFAGMSIDFSFITSTNFNKSILDADSFDVIATILEMGGASIS